MCHNPKCKDYQKQITFSQNQSQLESSGFKNKMKKIIKGCQTAWNKLLKPALKIGTPNISAGVAAKTKNPQSAQITSKISKSLPGGKILSLTDMHGRGLCLKVMRTRFESSYYNKMDYIRKCSKCKTN